MIQYASGAQSSDCEDENYASLRKRMVQQQILRRGIDDPRVLSAMLQVPRQQFVPAAMQQDAYADCALPIGWGQTISQPFTVAYMAAALRLEGSERVLEIGTGSGYGAAVLSHLAQKVYTVERIPHLARQAEQRLRRLGLHNIDVHVTDGSLGLSEQAPFDAIVVTAAAEELPPPYAEQLAEGGRIVIPIGDRAGQALYRFTKRAQQVRSENLGQFAFVPLIGRHGWSSSTGDLA